MNRPDAVPGPVTITVYPEGPLVIRGPVSVLDHNGVEIQNPRRTRALCRCGRSAIKPWCDGTHKIGSDAVLRCSRPDARR